MFFLPRRLQGLGFLLLNPGVSCVTAFLHQAAAPPLAGLVASQKQQRALAAMRVPALSTSATSGSQTGEVVQAEEVSFDFGDGMVMAAKVWGPETGVPLLGLHGWLDNAASFDRLGPHLAQAGVRLVAMDMPGHGRSSHLSQDSIYQVWDYMYWAMCVADKLGWKRFSLLGHSLGAAVASTMAGTLPDRIEKTVLIEALGPLARPAEGAPQHLKEGLVWRAKYSELSRGKTIVKSYKGVEAAVKARVQSLERMPGDMTIEEEAAATIVMRGLRGDGEEDVPPDYDGTVRFRHDQRLQGRSPVSLTEAQARAFLQEIKCPVLLFMGDKGWPYAPESMAARGACVAQLQVKTVSGSHHLHLDASSYLSIVPDVVSFLTAPPPNPPSAL